MEPMSDEFWRRFVDDVFDTSVGFYRQNPDLPPPDPDSIFNTLIFRYCICSFVCAIDWIGKGGYETVLDAKLMNDYTDMAYAAYATYYDGLLTEDRKLGEIHAVAARWVHRVFLKAQARSS